MASLSFAFSKLHAEASIWGQKLLPNEKQDWRIYAENEQAGPLFPSTGTACRLRNQTAKSQEQQAMC